MFSSGRSLRELVKAGAFLFFFFSSRRRHTRCLSDWSSDVCSSDLDDELEPPVPPNLGELSRGLSTLVEFLRLDPDLLTVAAHASATTKSNRAAREERSEERRVGKECRSRWSPYH